MSLQYSDEKPEAQEDTIMELVSSMSDTNLLLQARLTRNPLWVLGSGLPGSIGHGHHPQTPGPPVTGPLASVGAVPILDGGHQMVFVGLVCGSASAPGSPKSLSLR